MYDWFRRQHWTDDAYLALSDTSNHLLELSDGRPEKLPMPTLTHERVARRLYDRLSAWLAERQAGEALFAPHPVRLWPGKMREPDVMMWLSEHLDRLGEQFSDPPDLAAEVHSPRSLPLDRDIKHNEYARAGITEYWLVNPLTQAISVYVLQGESYVLLGHFGTGEAAASALLPNFSVAVDEIFQS